MKKYQPIFDEKLIEECHTLFFENLEIKTEGEKFDRCVKHVMDQGKSEDSAYAICQVSVGK